MNTNVIGESIENFHKAFKGQPGNIVSKVFKKFTPENYFVFTLESGKTTHSYMVSEDKIEESGIKQALTEVIREHCHSLLGVFKEQNLDSRFRILCRVEFYLSKGHGMSLGEKTEELRMDENGNLIEPEFMDSVQKGIELAENGGKVMIIYDFDMEIDATSDFKLHAPLTKFYIEIEKKHGYSKTSKKVLRY